jgi:hypothetical protein
MNDMTDATGRLNLSCCGRQQPLRFIRAYHEWNLLRCAQVIHLGSEVEPPQRTRAPCLEDRGVVNLYKMMTLVTHEFMHTSGHSITS